MNNYDDKDPILDKEIIKQNLIEYILKKDEYFFNYLIDGDIAQFIKSFEEYKNKKTPEEFSYADWQKDEKDKIVAKGLPKKDTDFLLFKLIFTTLMMYDKNYTGTDLEYTFRQFTSLNIVIVLGPKKWKENKITFGSCPFQNLRAISLNASDFATLQNLYTSLHDETLFNDKGLNAACAFLTQDENLGMKATQELNFKNLGINVVPAPKIPLTNEKLHDIIAGVDNAESAVLIFPELLVDENTDRLIDDNAANTKNLKLIVKGSRYVAENGHYTNTAYCAVKVGNTWNKNICSYNKRIPFTMGYTAATADAYHIDTKKYPLDKSELLVEDIVVDDRITVLPYKDCIVGVAICRDVLDLLDKNNPLHGYCDFVDLMLVISENNGDTNMFVGIAECLARWHNCATLYTNALHEAGETPDPCLEIAFALYPYKRTDPESKEYTRSSTSVSGVITYAAKAEQKIDPENDRLVTILNSKGITYEQLTKDEKTNGYKVYTFKTE